MNNFITYNSTNYEFHVQANSLAEQDIEQIIDIQENARKKIIDFLGLQSDRKIIYFLYPSNQIKAEAMGDDGNGNADTKRFEIHAVYNEKVKCIGAHEDTHLLAHDLGLPPQLFREGLAEYMSETWHGKTHDDWAKEFIASGRLAEIKDWINDDVWYEIDDRLSYPMAGSFIRFVIDKYGRDKFIELYSSMNKDLSREVNVGTLENILNVELTNLEQIWAQNLSQ